MSIENIFFIDVKTASQYPKYAALPASEQELWAVEAQRLRSYSNSCGATIRAYDYASLHPNFGKIIYINVAYVVRLSDGSFCMNNIVFNHPDERELLESFRSLLLCHPHHQLVADYGLGFDFPYIQRRFKALDLELPDVLDTRDEAPGAVSRLVDVKLMLANGYGVPMEVPRQAAEQWTVDEAAATSHSWAYWRGDHNYIATSSDRYLKGLVKLYCLMVYEDEDQDLVFVDHHDDAYAS
jgi:hypothetical protein